MLREITNGDEQFKPVKIRDIFLKKRDFKLCTYSYFPIEEYIKIIKQKYEISKVALLFTRIN